MRLWTLVIVSAALTACGNASPASKAAPAVVTNLIHELQTQAPTNPPAYVASYDYQGKVVYYVPPRCCDIFSDLYDASGRLICHPDGGVAGHGDGRCPDFLAQRTHESILWRNP